METNIVIHISPPIPYLAKLANELRAKILLANQSFLHVDSILLGGHSQACPKSQNNKFAITLQYLNENVKYEVDFSPAHEHRRFFKIHTIILGVFGGAQITN